MRNDNNGQALVLKDLAREFSNFRRNHGGKSERCWYPDDLKRSVLAAVQLGCTVKQVAEAIEISSQSIANWRRASQSIVKNNAVIIDEAPRELHMMADGSEYPADLGKTFEGSTQSRIERPMARLKFSSGVQMVLPVKALSFELLESLSRLGGIRC